MSKKNNNPYRDGSAYHKIYADILKAKGICTCQGLIDLGHSPHDVRVVLSTRIDSRGNLSCRSESYYLAPLKKVKGEDQKFRLRRHNPPLEKLTRKSASAKSEQVESKQTKSKDKSKAKSKAKSKKGETVEAVEA